VALVTVAVTGAAKPLPGMEFNQSGHWVLNVALGVAFHVDGPNKHVDASAPLPDAEPGQVVQSDTGGYVIGGSKITGFGKSTLQVENVTEAPADEIPVALEVRGGPYVVYREAGIIVRLGKQPVTMPAGGKLGGPVSTREGTVWLHRVDAGLLCELPAGADRVSCKIALPAGHTGALTVVGDRPVFVDTTDDVLRPVGASGLEAAVPLGVNLPPMVQVASTDVAGKVAVLDQPGSRLHLLDSGGKAKPVRVDLPPGGDYAGIAASGPVVALVDRRNDSVLTYRGDGEKRETKAIPGGDGPVPLAKGEDGQIYVDGADGAHVLVVDSGGAVSQVPAIGGGRKVEENKLVPPPVEPPPPVVNTPSPGPGAARQPNLPRQPRNPGPQKPTTPVVPASPPGVPGKVTAAAGNASATVNWTAAAANGAAVTGYVVSWPGGERTVGGNARTVTINGLANGTAYVFTVAAVNRAGAGPGANSAAVTPQAPQTVPKVPGKAGSLNVRIKVGDTDATVTWTAAAPNGSPVTAYTVKWAREDGARPGSITLPGSARSYIIEDIWQGEDVPFTVTVTAANSAGQGAPVSVRKVQGDTPANRKITISRGKDTTANQCGPPNCAFLHIVMTGFTPGKSMTITAYASDTGTHGSVTRTIGPGGTLEFEYFSMGTPSRTVWVRAESVESNRLFWEPR
jgi:hypothetical protein